MKATFPHFARLRRGLTSALRLLLVLSGAAWVCAAGVAPPALETDGTLVVARPAPGTLLAYTLNGVDPRGPRDMPGLTAQFASEPLVVGTGTLLVVRAFAPAGDAGSPWSPALAARDAVRVEARTAGPLFASRLANLSALVHVAPAAPAPIVGFVVAGNRSHLILIRAIGPALAGFGLAGALPDPEIVLRRADGSVVSRTAGWTADPLLPWICASVGAFPLPDASSDGALLVQLAPGAYTLQIASASGQSGLALAEVYDVDRASGFTGFSARAAAGPDRRILTGGFVVAGSTPRKMLVRAIGPGLGALGAADTQGHPSLTLFAGPTAIARNDDWTSAATEVAAATAAAGTFKLTPGSEDAALVITLAPGAYTAQITTHGPAAGAFLLEVHAVP